MKVTRAREQRALFSLATVPLMDALLVDLYELTMGESYLAEGLDERPATFSGMPHRSCTGCTCPQPSM